MRRRWIVRGSRAFGKTTRPDIFPSAIVIFYWQACQFIVQLTVLMVACGSPHVVGFSDQRERKKLTFTMKTPRF